MANLFPVQKIIRGNTSKPKDAEFTGRYHGNQQIYAEKVAIIEQQVVKDAAGEVVYKHWNNGRKRPEMEPVVVGYETREFVIDDLGNGMTPKNYAFAPDPAEIAREQAREKASPERMVAFMERLEKGLNKLGVNLDEVLEHGEDAEPVETGGAKGKSK